MKLSCSQMDVLISFYIDGDLSNTLKKEVEAHLKKCPSCKAKFEIIKSMLSDLKNCFDLDKDIEQELNVNTQTEHYKLFKNNLSAYIDNELPNEENIKIKKFTISNNNARRDLEESYNLRRLMNDSFKKTKTESRYDFSKNILKQLELDDDNIFGIHPAIKILVGLTIAVLIVTSFILISFSV